MTDLKNKMISAVNKLLSKFKLYLVSSPPPKEYNYVEEAVKWLDSINVRPDNCDWSTYVGDITYVEDKNGKTYFQDANTKKWYCDYDYKNPSKPVLLHMIEETTFDLIDLQKKLKDDESTN